MDNIPEDIRQRLATHGYTDIPSFPNNPNSVRWDIVKTECGLSNPDINRIISAIFPDVSHSGAAAASTVGYTLPENWYTNLEQEVAALRQLRQLEIQQQRDRQQNKIIRRTANLRNVNVALETFSLPNGIRRFIYDKALSLGLRGYVKRSIHHHVNVCVDGTAFQIAHFFDILDDLKVKHIVGTIEVAHDVEMINGHVYRDFTIESNEHKRCHKNPNSNSDEWDKKSSTVGSYQEFCPDL